MKHAKKLIYTDNMGFVPESEYFYDDPLKTDKIKTKIKILKTLRNPRLTQLEKHVKYQSLNRSRQRIIKNIESKPLHVIIDSKTPKELPTSGVEPRKQDYHQEEQPIAHENIDDQREPMPEEEQARVDIQKPRKTLIDFKGIITPQKAEMLADIIFNNRAEFGILATGGIFKNKSSDTIPYRGSHYRNVLKYLAGQSEIPEDQKSVTTTFIKRMLRNDQIKNIITQQGEGMRAIREIRERRRIRARRDPNPRYIIDLDQKYIKNKRTKGLVRQFRPTLWTKVPV